MKLSVVASAAVAVGFIAVRNLTDELSKMGTFSTQHV